MHEYRINRGYRALINASLLNGIGNALYNIVFVIYASTLPFKTLAVSLASFATLIPTLLMLVTGFWADRAAQKTGRMIIARVLQFGLFLLLALLIQQPGSLLIFLILLAINVVSDILGQYANSLELPIFRDLIADTELNSAMGFQSATQTTIALVFQGVGAWAIVLLQHNFALFGVINAVTFLAAALVIAQHRQLLRSAEPKPSTARAQTFHASWQVLRETVRTSPFIGLSLILAFLANGLATSIDGLQNVTLLRQPHYWLGNYGNTIALLSIVFSLGLITGALFSQDFCQHLSLLTLISLVLLGAVLLGVSFLLNWGIWAALVLNFAMAYLLGKINPRFSSIMLLTVDADHLGAAMGAMVTVVMLGAPLGQAVFLGIANAAGPALSWAIFALGSGLVSIVALVFSRRVSDPSLTMQPDTL